MAGNYTWEIRSSEGGMLGLEVARALMDPAEVALAHALPSRVHVEVRDNHGELVASGEDLEADANTPMARLELAGKDVRRSQVWPTREDYGLPVILPGGEVGVLLEWWNAEDGSEWRWRIEFYNHT